MGLLHDWVEVLRGRELLEAIDVKTLVDAGLNPWDVERLPESLSRDQIIQAHSGEHDFDHSGDG